MCSVCSGGRILINTIKCDACRPCRNSESSIRVICSTLQLKSICEFSASGGCSIVRDARRKAATLAAIVFRSNTDSRPIGGLKVLTCSGRGRYFITVRLRSDSISRDRTLRVTGSVHF